MESKTKEPIYKKVVLVIVALFFGIVSIVIWAVPVLKFHGDSQSMGAYLEDINGFQLAFGGKVYRHVVGPYPGMEFPLNPCPLATVTFIIIALAFILCVISLIFTVKQKNNKAYKIIVISSVALYFIGGIMCFFLDKSFALSSQQEELNYFKNRMINNYNVCPFYAIITITCAFLTSIQFLNFKKKN